MEQELPQKAEYALVKPLRPDIALVRRLSDGELFLRQEYNLEERPELEELLVLYKRGAYAAAGQVLNHENMMGLTGPTEGFPFQGWDGTDAAKKYILWDWCDAGTLDIILREPPFSAGPDGFLPESLVWHVALSMLKALMWLHEGYRLRPAEPPGQGVGTLYRPDDDWMPILHREIEPRNIYFQSRRGIQTYGRCKLGNLANCYVSGSVGATVVADDKRDTETERADQAVTTKEGDPPLKEMKKLWKEELGAGNQTDSRSSESKSQHPYTVGSELFALGTIIYRMMRGRRLPDPDGCDFCTCVHINPPPEQVCGHVCAPDVHLDDTLLAMTKYTAGLREVLKRLLAPGLGPRRLHSDRAVECYTFAAARYLDWKNGDPDGQLYRDEQDERVICAANEEKRREEGAEDKMEGVRAGTDSE